MQITIEAINKVETLIVDALSKTDKEILELTIEEILLETKKKEVSDYLKKILKTFKKQWWNFDETPWYLSFIYFGKNIFDMSNFQYRLVYYQGILEEVKKIISEDVFPSILKDKLTVFIVSKILMRFEDILGNGVNFRGKRNDDLYYEERFNDYSLVSEVNKELIKRDCEFLRELFAEML